MDKPTFKILLAATAIVAGAGVAYAQGPGQGKRFRGTDMTFESLDVDGSGEITTEDMEAMREARFAHMDADGNGSVNREEFSAVAQARAAERAAAMFGRLDADGDGVLSRDVLEGRMQKGPNPRMVSRLDTDNSGGVSKAEFDAAMEKRANRRMNRRKSDGHRHGRGSSDH